MKALGDHIKRYESDYPLESIGDVKAWNFTYMIAWAFMPARIWTFFKGDQL